MHAEPDTIRSASRILLVEDDATMRELLTDLLREEGYSVDAAADGTRAATRLFLEPGGLDDYDLVLSDANLPGLTGIELAERLVDAFGPPLVLISAFATPELIREGLEAGVIEVIAKPFDLERLMKTIRALAPPEA